MMQWARDAAHPAKLSECSCRNKSTINTNRHDYKRLGKSDNKLHTELKTEEETGEGGAGNGEQYKQFRVEFRNLMLAAE